MKICEKCGTKWPDDAVFCGTCGNSLDGSRPGGQMRPAENSQGTRQTSEQPKIRPRGDAPKSYGSKRSGSGDSALKAAGKPPLVLLAVCGGAALIIIVILAFVLMNRKTTIRVGDYVTIQVEGRDGYATATYDFDTESFYEDYADKLEFSEDALSDFGNLIYGEGAAAQYFIAQYQYGTLSATSDLSNGDEIVWTSCLAPADDSDTCEAEEIFRRCQVKDFTVSMTVSGLTDVAQVNPLDCASVTFSGVAPNGTAELHTDGSTDPEIDQELRDEITLEPSTGLSNGDTVTISFKKSRSDSDYAEDYGVVPIEGQRQFTVEGLSTYMSTTEEVPAELLEQLKTTAQKSVSSEASALLSQATVTGTSYIGNYFLLAMDMEDVDWANRLTLVYRVDATSYNALLQKDIAESIYVGVGYDNLILLADGTAETDLAVSSLYSGSTLGDIFTACVEPYEDDYTYENHVSDTAQETTAAETTAAAAGTSGRSTETEQALQYFIEHADTQYFSESDISGFDKETCRLARNGVYARMGREFEDETLTAYFSQFDWYQPTIAADDFSESILNKYQKENLKMIVAYEEKMGYR